MVTERIPDHLPCCDQVLLAVGGDQNAGADDVVQLCPGVGQRGLQVLDSLGRLPGDVLDRRGGTGYEECGTRWPPSST